MLTRTIVSDDKLDANYSGPSGHRPRFEDLTCSHAIPAENEESSKGDCALFQQPSVSELLGRIVGRCGNHWIGRDDLFQEGRIHLWRLEEQRPGQTPSWYLQNCHFYLINLLGMGKSLDAPKRRSNAVPLDETALCLESHWATIAFEEVSARDAVMVLAEKLTPCQRTLLDLLLQGLGIREISRRLGISHPTVIKQRRSIASRARQLGIESSRPSCGSSSPGSFLKGT